MCVCKYMDYMHMHIFVLNAFLNLSPMTSFFSFLSLLFLAYFTS